PSPVLFGHAGPVPVPPSGQSGGGSLVRSVRPCPSLGPTGPVAPGLSARSGRAGVRPSVRPPSLRPSGRDQRVWRLRRPVSGYLHGGRVTGCAEGGSDGPGCHGHRATASGPVDRGAGAARQRTDRPVGAGGAGPGPAGAGREGAP